MFSGNGQLITRMGDRIPLKYDMINSDGPSCAGRLSCDTSTIDPTALLYVMRLICEDGKPFDIAATNHSDRHISFIGRRAA
jgi:hypothetical protein